jgi:CRP/FNR family transcriptional regulator, cyclic AMP receptor protein
MATADASVQFPKSNPESAPTPAVLARLPLFGGLSDTALQAFADRAVPLNVDAGDNVFVEGDSARTLYVVQQGLLEIVKQRGGEEIVLSRITPGECFGEMSFIDMQPRSATVRALEPSSLWSWPYQAIHERYCNDNKCYMLLVMNIARELSRRLRKADELLCGKR